MNSFDFYDTLFTRLVATPAAIFQLVERLTGLRNFAEARAAAETRANRRSPAREISLEQIYDLLDHYPKDSREAAKELELRLEQRLLVPIRRNLERLRDGDLVVSDMYLPEPLFRKAIEEHTSHSNLSFVISSTVGLRKLDGSIWRELRKQQLAIELHIGDNVNSDVRQPRSHGIPVEHYRGARLNRFEREWLRYGLDGNLVAGISRAARLGASVSDTGLGGSLHEIFASVVAPILVEFVEHVLDSCASRGIRRIVFLARDGQLLHRIAQRIVTARSLPIDTVYAYGSRHALHLAGHKDIIETATWLLEDTPNLTVSTIAKRGEIPTEVLLAACKAVGIMDPEKNIPRGQRDQLQRVIRSPDVIAALADTAARRWKTAYDYYCSVGLAPGANVALVDVGWKGQMQASLRSVLDKGSDRPAMVTGYYFCLSNKVWSSERDELNGFLFDPERDEGLCPFDAYRPVIETCLLADHGSTLGFHRHNDVIAPTLDSEPSAQMLEVIRRQQQTVLRFVDLFLLVEAETDLRLRWPQGVARRNLKLMLESPTRSEASAYLEHRLSIEQGQSEDSILVNNQLTLKALWNRQLLGLWPEGSVAASNKRYLLPGLALARAGHALRKMIRRSHARTGS